MVRALASIVMIALLGACGRIDFDPLGDTGGDGGGMDGGAIDSGAIDSGAIDAPSLDAPVLDASDSGQASYCNELSGATEAECTAAIDSFTGTPEIFYACALACRLGRCFVLDAPDCPGCACEAYVKSSQICDEAGNCGPPLSGSGCVGGGYYAGPPMRCAGGGTLAQEGGCILRYLVSAGNCD